MRMRSFVLAALFSACVPAITQAQVGHAFHISHLRCKAATCTVGNGYQPGLLTVEVSGNLPAYAGYSVRLIVARRSGGNFQTVSETTLGIFSDGHFTASIPAYNLRDGAYVFAVMPKNANTLLAGGLFAKNTPAIRERAASSAPSSSSSLAGEWIGIAGTYGRVRISSNGTYMFNDQPGTYRRSGNEIVFSGPLSVWNGGRATIGSGVIEFYWTTAQGAKQYFVFEKT